MRPHHSGITAQVPPESAPKSRRNTHLHQLDTFAALEKLIAFYVEQHNTVVPHAAFAGQTPDEMYFGRGEQVPADLAELRAKTFWIFVRATATASKLLKELSLC
jgi:hypothetical protein